MFYKNLRFPNLHNRPFFYTNFVSTIDGVVGVKVDGYWPIGSKKDYQVLLELRAYADVLIHGSNLASQFGEITAQNIQKEEFKSLRTKLGKKTDLKYIVISNLPKKFAHLNADIFTGDLSQLAKQLHEQNFKNILVEGGPMLLTSFIKEELLDELFLTIAPKLFGHNKQHTLNLVQDVLFEPKKIKTYKLLSNKSFGNEVFLRFRRRKN